MGLLYYTVLQASGFSTAPSQFWTYNYVEESARRERMWCWVYAVAVLYDSIIVSVLKFLLVTNVLRNCIFMIERKAAWDIQNITIVQSSSVLCTPKWGIRHQQSVSCHVSFDVILCSKCELFCKWSSVELLCVEVRYMWGQRSLWLIIIDMQFSLLLIAYWNAMLCLNAFILICMLLVRPTARHIKNHTFMPCV